MNDSPSKIMSRIDLLTAQVRPTNLCQLDCLGCWYYGKDSMGKPTAWKTNSIALNTYADLIADLETIGFKKLVISGGGDPFAHPKIYDLIEMASQKFEVFMLTNLLLCRNPVRLANSGIKEIIVNTSAATRETFLEFHPNLKPQATRGLDPFGELIKLINRIKAQVNVKLNFVVGKVNQAELFDIIELGHELKVEVQFKNLRDSNWGLTIEERRKIASLLPSLRAHALSLGVKTNLESYSASSDLAPIENQRCYAGFYTTVIEANGDVCFCCMPGADAHPIGNVNEMRLKDIWTSRKYDEFRERFLNKQFESYCQGCIYFERNQAVDKKLSNPLVLE